MPRYLSDARHPWACVVFVLPLLGLYEGGIRFLSGADPDALRNGADVWLRWGLQKYGVNHPWAAPAVVAGLLLVRAWATWNTRPKDLLTAVFGMTVESVGFAAVLWTVARNAGGLFRDWGVPAAAVGFHTPAAEQVVTYVGAGVYEEVLFRLGLFSAVAFFLRIGLVPGPVAGAAAACAAALAFAAAHHVGPHGEPMAADRFLFRTVAGLYFTALYVFRGFGVAVGAHAGYDVLVGVSVG